MQALYTEDEKEALEQRARRFRKGMIAAAAGSFALCAALCFFVNTANAGALQIAVIALSTLAGWAVILLGALGYAPARAESTHMAGLLGNPERETFTGRLVINTAADHLPRSIWIRRAKLTDGEGREHRLSVLARKRDELPGNGQTVTVETARKYGAEIVPVDSEHSAIFQCLQGEHARIEKILLTGSGGPFLHSSKAEIAAATREQALNHPRWKMGAKVTIDSASLMNKGLELIEARWLFGMDPADIEVVIHPQSVIHSMVQFSDGCVMAQLSQPDMRLPIQYALSYPQRIDLNTQRIDFALLAQLTFEKPDLERFPCLGLAYAALEKGGNATCIMNGANEVAVAAFLEGRIRFTDIPDIIAETMDRCHFVAEPDLDAIYSTDFEAKRLAAKLTDRKTH